MNTATIAGPELDLDEAKKLVSLVANRCPIELSVVRKRDVCYGSMSSCASPGHFKRELRILEFTAKKAIKIIHMEQAVRSPSQTERALDLVGTILAETLELIEAACL